MVDNRTRERLTGAAILVALIVLLVPELLSGPRRAAPHLVAAVDEAPVRSYTLSLGDAPASVTPVPAQLRRAGAAGRALVPAPEGPAEPAEGAALAGSADAAGAVRRADGKAEAPASEGAAPARTTVAPPVHTEAAVPARAAGGAPAHPAQAAQAHPAHAAQVRPAHEAPAHPAALPKIERTAGGWAVQVGSFESRENADRLVRRLKLEGYGAFVSESTSRGRKWYRVRVGPERDRAAADAVAGRLRAAGLRGAVARPR